jgi:hypothetical protein
VLREKVAVKKLGDRRGQAGRATRAVFVGRILFREEYAVRPPECPMIHSEPEFEVIPQFARSSHLGEPPFQKMSFYETGTRTPTR